MKQSVCVVGNPNCGKTTLFNALTGSHQDVGNWPGVTVEKKVGYYSYDGVDFELVDLPGIYSLTTVSSTGEDERVARDYILSHQSQAVINIVDASNLERNLYLTAQLIEMRVPMMVVVNMLDVAKKRKIEIRLDKLSEKLGCPVIGVVASREQGLFALKEMINAFVRDSREPKLSLSYDPKIEAAHREIERAIKTVETEHPHWLAIELLEGANGARDALTPELRAKIAPIIEKTAREFKGDLDIALANSRYRLVADVSKEVIHRIGEVSMTLTDKVDRIVLNRVLGFPIFLFVIYVMFLFTENLGGAFIDFFDILVGGVMVDGMGALLEIMGVPEIVKVVLADGIGGGIRTVATFIPIVAFLFFFLAVLEDSGYMARAAFVMDRLMRFLGLPGKAFVPLIVGFGCNVSAVLATRTMDHATDRVITVLMAPFMSCGARLPIYVLFAAAFFPENGQNLVFGLYLIGIFMAILTGFLVKRLGLPGAVSSFVMEIPPYHIPTVKGVLLRTWDRSKGFVLRAGHVIVIIVACLSILNSLGTDGTFGHEDSEKSVIAAVGKTVVPVLEPLGIEKENWPAAVGIVTGVLAKESVIGTLNSLYDSISRSESGVEKTIEKKTSKWSFVPVWNAASASVVNNISALVNDDAVRKDTSDAKVGESTIYTMQRLFGSSFSAFCFLLLVLLYMPCCAALAAIWKEAGTWWTVFVAIWTTSLGWACATVVYRIGVFTQNPAQSMIYILSSFALLAVVLTAMHFFARKFKSSSPKIIRIYPESS